MSNPSITLFQTRNDEVFNAAARRDFIQTISDRVRLVYPDFQTLPHVGSDSSMFSMDFGPLGVIAVNIQVAQHHKSKRLLFWTKTVAGFGSHSRNLSISLPYTWNETGTTYVLDEAKILSKVTEIRSALEQYNRWKVASAAAQVVTKANIETRVNEAIAFLLSTDRPVVEQAMDVNRPNTLRLNPRPDLNYPQIEVRETDYLLRLDFTREISVRKLETALGIISHLEADLKP